MAFNMLPQHSPSTADHDAGHSVGETVREQAGDVIVHDLHLTTLELSDLIQADLVLLWVLGEKEGKEIEDEEKRSKLHAWV